MSDPEAPDWGDGDEEVADSTTEPTTAFPDFQTWVGEWLTAIIQRPFKSGSTWCPEWWEHPEAVARLDALWRAWEAARIEGGSGMSYWWTMHFDSHFAVLSDDTRGPFAACKDQVHEADAHKQLATLPCNPEPAGFRWPDTYAEETYD